MGVLSVLDRVTVPGTSVTKKSGELRLLARARVSAGKLLLIFLVLPATRSVAATVVPAGHYGVGGDPRSIAAADLNHDGKLDLVVANRQTNDVSVLMGHGDGTFRPAVSVPVPNQPHVVAIDDFDRDGALDLAVAYDGWMGGETYASGLVVLLGDGVGRFPRQSVTPLSLPPNGDGSVWAFGIGDFTGDGWPDLALLGSYAISVLGGRGDGTFDFEASNSLPDLSPFTMAAADLNQDGAPDLVVSATVWCGFAVCGKAVVTFLNRKPFGFNWGTEVRFNASVNDAANLDLAVRDLNGDGRLDVICASQHGVFALLGNGDGTFVKDSHGEARRPIWSPESSSYFVDRVVAGDFDGDGRLDLAVTGGGGARYDDEVTVLWGRGDGLHFDPRLPTRFRGAALGGMVAGDFNGDGRSDLAVLDQMANAVRILIGTR